MPGQAMQSGPFPGILSELDIDIAKDWQGYDISNLGGLEATGLDCLGDDMIVNGGFDTDTDWDKTGTVVISGGVADWGTTGGNTGTLSPTVPLNIQVGMKYKLTVGTANVRNSSIDITCGGVAVGTMTGGAGLSFAFVFEATTTDDLLFDGTVTGGPKTSCNIDDVALVPLGTVEAYVGASGFMLKGAFELDSDNVYDIGADGVGIRRIFLGEPIGSYALPFFTGLTATYTNGDMYIGNDNVYPGYYVQKTVVAGSTAADNSDDYTNLYQGDAGYQRISLMYDIPWDAGAENGMEFHATEQDTGRFYWGSFPFAMYREGSTSKFVLDGSTNAHSFLEIGLSHGVNQEAVRPDTDALIDLGDAANALRWRQLHLTDGVFVAGNQVVGSQQAGIADAVTAHDLNAIYSDTEVEAALDALGTKINSIITALEAHGLLATV